MTPHNGIFPNATDCKSDRYGQVHRPKSAKRRGALCAGRSLVKIVGCKNTLTGSVIVTLQLVFKTIDLNLLVAMASLHTEDGDDALHTVHDVVTVT